MSFQVDPDDNDVIVLDDDEFIQTTLNMVINSPTNHFAHQHHHQLPSTTSLNDCSRSPMHGDHVNNSSSFIIDLTNDFDLDDLFLLDYVPPRQEHEQDPEPLDYKVLSGQMAVDPRSIKNEMKPFEMRPVLAPSPSSALFGVIEEAIVIDGDDDGGQSGDAAARQDANQGQAHELTEIELASLLLDFNNENRRGQQKAAERSPEETGGSSSRVFNCTLCQKSFNKSYNFKRHMFTHQVKSAAKPPTNEVFSVNQCPICQRRIVDKSNFAKHLKLCQKKVERNEPVAIVSSDQREIAAQHTECSEPGQFKCKLCKHIFGKKFNLHRHLRVHYLNDTATMLNSSSSPKQPSCPSPNGGCLVHQCDRCSRRFAEAKQLADHRRKWHETSYKCKICDASKFAERLDYMKHLNREHSVKFRFECQSCFKSFRFYSHFMQHRATHLIQQLQSNTQTQSAESKQLINDAECSVFVCQHCGKSFSKAFNLNRHIKSKHQDQGDNDQ